MKNNYNRQLLDNKLPSIWPLQILQWTVYYRRAFIGGYKKEALDDLRILQFNYFIYLNAFCVFILFSLSITFV